MGTNVYIFYFLPLIMGFAHGLLFAFLLVIRGVREERASDLFLASLLFAGCLLLLPTLLGFLDIHVLWNEWLFLPIDPGLLIGPLLYLFIVAHTNRAFRFTRQHLMHFIPFGIYAVYHLVIFVQGREYVFQWMDTIDLPYINPVYQLITLVVMGLYLGMAIKHYRQYRQWVETEYVDPAPLRYPWITRFLWAIALTIAATCLLRIVELLQFDFDFIQAWLSSTMVTICIYYISIAGFMSVRPPLTATNPTPKTKLEPANGGLDEAEISKELDRLIAYMESGKAYLDPDLSLSGVARSLGISRETVSAVINTGQGKNFRSFVNQYRVEAFKEAVAQGQAEELTLFGLALECGFNSKATFNRVFKQIEGVTPNAFAASLKA